LLFETGRFKLFLIAPFKVVKDAAGHHTWHEGLNRVKEYEVLHFGLDDPSNPEWIKPLFNQSIKRRFPTVDPLIFFKFLRKIRSSDFNMSCVAIFEGSLFWAFFMSSASLFHPNKVFVCNLWPSYKYLDLVKSNSLNGKVFRWCLRTFNRVPNLILTVDTKVLADLISQTSKAEIKVFPVPSSLNFRHETRFESEHKRVLLNLRGFDESRLMKAIKKSCPNCLFHVSFNKDRILQFNAKFGIINNLEMGSHHITPENYERYIDTFDHAVFFYQPLPSKPGEFSHYCASGRLLDVLLRRIPVSLPDKGSEWINIAQRWGKSSTFNFESDEEVEKALNHPVFTGCDPIEIPPFTPLGAIRELKILSTNKWLLRKQGGESSNLFIPLKKLLVLFLFSVSWCIGNLSNLAYTLHVFTSNRLRRYSP